MPQRPNPGTADPNAPSIPQEHDDELEMADDTDDEFEDDEHFDAESELDDDVIDE